MKHPWLFKNTQRHDYSGQMLNVQMPQIVDVPSDLVKTNFKNKQMKNFASTLLASLLGAILAGIILFFLGFLIIIGIASSAEEKESVEIENHTILNLGFDVKITDCVFST